ncbi:mitochondrial phosphate carrier protein 3, mitochondrial-like [Cucurbita moschata]|uniref:Mitochondrial phosphate carrier protein 3, mitochondrial-like n=1 Tax=Cucurbita moschata TaxID=3662 RepID=A0A6J1EZ83_CUCMO|nr:mitochondrial phosphate carrier protein 3, mitochondrial-like [Cucurbita moschata]
MNWTLVQKPGNVLHKDRMVSEVFSEIDPTKYKNTLPGYSAQGACKFGSYEFFKNYYSYMVGTENAANYKTFIYLAASASAEVIADVALCPMEAVKVGVQTLRSILKALQRPGSSLGASDRFHVNTMMKFASFQTIVERLYTCAIPRPKEQCSKSLQLGVRLLPTTGGATTAPAANKSRGEPVCAP